MKFKGDLNKKKGKDYNKQQIENSKTKKNSVENNRISITKIIVNRKK